MFKPAIAVIGGTAILDLYVCALASVCIFRDRSLTWRTRTLRIVVAWFAPFLGAILILRFASEESPQYLPGGAWTWFLRPLLHENSTDCRLPEVTDIVSASDSALPGQTLYHGGD
jgi:hypothetical protein